MKTPLKYANFANMNVFYVTPPLTASLVLEIIETLIQIAIVSLVIMGILVN
jgi:hypothetical protein